MDPSPSSLSNVNFSPKAEPAWSRPQGPEEHQPLRGPALEEELRFYENYPWSLQVFPTLGDLVERLRQELLKPASMEAGWQAKEVGINVFLLACGIGEAVDDYLLGPAYDFSKVAVVLPFAGPLSRLAAKAIKAFSPPSRPNSQRLWRWRQDWDNAVQNFFQVCLLNECASKTERGHSCDRLTNLMPPPCFPDLKQLRPRIPAALHSQDLTHHDVTSLGEKLMKTFVQRKRPIIVVGLRTAGSYFAPALSAHLKFRGYERAESITVRPKWGISKHEQAKLRSAASAAALAVLIDEPPGSGSTLMQAIEQLRSAGFPDKSIVILTPVHPAMRDWRSRGAAQWLSGIQTITLEPDEYYKFNLLSPRAVEQRLTEYFGALGYSGVTLRESTAVLKFNQHLTDLSEEKSQNRLKCVYEVCLQNPLGETETRWVLAKSVGWGWLSYHAFIAGNSLSEFVPSVLGLRDGLLYSEWLCSEKSPLQADRGQFIKSAASYISQRARRLKLSEDPTADLAAENRNLGLEKLTDLLARVYGSKIASTLKRSRVQRDLLGHASPQPIFIDGKMRLLEWISNKDLFYKTDFEQHGFGKYELSSCDPAHDLADFILSLQLSSCEERDFVEQYATLSGDVSVKDRLFLKKLQSGSWALSQAVENLSNPRLVRRHQEFHERYMEALNFLVIHTMRHCASLCQRSNKVEWREPLLMLDIDGVLDKQSFGFPSTSAAGIQALSLLHAHESTVAINTARSVDEVKEYCRSYGFAGGVAEYGSWVWDRVHDREAVLVSPQSLQQLEWLRHRLRAIPGVFLNDAYQYCVKAFVYARGTTVPLPEGIIRDLMASLKLDRLRLWQTFTDSTVTATETNKGHGLLELLALAGQPGMETIAVGDSEPDLPMFAVAKRCFAPSNISCKQAARFFKCRIAGQPYQRGLLEVVQSLAHSGTAKCAHCEKISRSTWSGFFWKLLEEADQRPKRLLIDALLDPMSINAFRR